MLKIPEAKSGTLALACAPFSEFSNSLALSISCVSFSTLLSPASIPPVIYFSIKAKGPLQHSRTNHDVIKYGQCVVFDNAAPRIGNYQLLPTRIRRILLFPTQSKYWFCNADLRLDRKTTHGCSWKLMTVLWCWFCRLAKYMAINPLAAAYKILLIR